MGQSNQILYRTADTDLHTELWISLGSLLRSYAAAHGLHNDIHAVIEINENRIVARHGNNWLELVRTDAEIVARRENGSSQLHQLTPAGRLRNHEAEVELDMAAEAWARDLMRESKQ